MNLGRLVPWIVAALVLGAVPFVQRRSSTISPIRSTS
jgi:hypothetical protein